MAGPHAEAVKASIKAHDPQAGDTLNELYTDWQQVRVEQKARGDPARGRSQ